MFAGRCIARRHFLRFRFHFLRFWNSDFNNAFLWGTRRKKEFSLCLSVDCWVWGVTGIRGDLRRSYRYDPWWGHHLSRAPQSPELFLLCLFKGQMISSYPMGFPWAVLSHTLAPGGKAWSQQHHTPQPQGKLYQISKRHFQPLNESVHPKKKDTAQNRIGVWEGNSLPCFLHDPVFQA